MRRSRLRGRWSLLLVAAVLVLYALSFLRAAGVTLVTVERDPDGTTTHLHSRMLISDFGGIILRRQVGWTTDPVIYRSVGEKLPRGWALQFDSAKANHARGRKPTLANLLWFDTEWVPAGVPGGRYTVTGVWVPYWAPALAVAAPPLLVALRRRRRDRLRRRRVTRGLCPACGYDLRGSGETCPECGGVA